MKVFITGTRRGTDEGILREIFKDDIDCLVAGPLAGVEEQSIKLAEELGIKIDYTYYGTNPYVKRIEEVINELKRTDGVLVCFGDESEYSIMRCREENVKYRVI